MDFLIDFRRKFTKFLTHKYLQTRDRTETKSRSKIPFVEI